MTRVPRYLSGRTGMAKFDSLMKATFNPPRNWTLLEDLKFYSDELDIVSATMLRDCDVQAGIEFIYHMREHLVDVTVATAYLFACYALYLYLKKVIK